MNALGLSAEQLAERRLRLHAGDAASIMVGDYRRVFRRVKFGEDNDLYDDLPWFIQKRLTRKDLEFKAALGNYLEPFNLAYTMQETGRVIEYFSANMLCQNAWYLLTGSACNIEELVISKRYPWMACNLDGMTRTPQGYRSVIDAKPRTKDVDILLYTPAGVWQATCAGTDWWSLAGLVVGNKWEPPIFQEVDPIYQATMIAKARECWGYIEANEEPPEAMGETLPPKPAPRLRTVTVPTEADEVFEALCRQENWLSEACREIGRFVDTHAAATAHAITRVQLKTIVPEDVGTLTRGRFKLSRDKAGAVRMSLAKLDDDE